MQRRTVTIGALDLEATLNVPAKALGLVLFAHGSGSSRFSQRNARVALALNGRGFATLLLDLLTTEEAASRGNVFDIALLGRRVADAVAWVRGEPSIGDLPIGLFGASTGAAAALVAAAFEPSGIGAIVSRGGRPDLAGGCLAEVRAPTLLIVGGADHDVIGLNREALDMLRCVKELTIVPGATHLFEEPGALDEVIGLACAWFERHLGRQA